jgi:ABC-type thiamine transport system substrate-binding protein
MNTESKKSLSNKISQSLLNAAQPVAELTAATSLAAVRSKVRVSSLDSMTVTNPIGESRGLKVQNKTDSTVPFTDVGNGAKVVALKSANKKMNPTEDAGD